MGTTGLQLEQSFKKSRSKLPFIIRTKNNLKPSDYREPLICIFNLQDSTKGSGTHWTCAIIPPPSRTVNGIKTADKNYYFDSFGAPPPEEVVRFLKTKNRKIIYSDQQLQKIDSDTCGEHVLNWIRYMSQYLNGKSDQMLQQKYLKFVYDYYDPKDLEGNDKKVMNKVKIRTQ